MHLRNEDEVGCKYNEFHVQQAVIGVLCVVVAIALSLAVINNIFLQYQTLVFHLN